MTLKEKHEATKARHELYRSAARQHGTVRDHVAVCECEGGAFVEVIVWIDEHELSALAANEKTQ